MQKLSSTESGEFADKVKRSGEYTVGVEYTIGDGEEIKIYELGRGAQASGRLIGKVRAMCEVSDYDYVELRSREPFEVNIEGETYSFPVNRSFKIMKKPLSYPW